jgi:hypothetical protein
MWSRARGPELRGEPAHEQPLVGPDDEFVQADERVVQPVELSPFAERVLRPGDETDLREPSQQVAIAVTGLPIRPAISERRAAPAAIAARTP